MVESLISVTKSGHWVVDATDADGNRYTAGNGNETLACAKDLKHHGTRHISTSSLSNDQSFVLGTDFQLPGTHQENNIIRELGQLLNDKASDVPSSTTASIALGDLSPLAAACETLQNPKGKKR